MQKSTILPALLAALTYHQSAQADTQARLESTEQRIRSLEDRMLGHDENLRKTGWSDRIEIGGLIEIEADLQEVDDADRESGLTLATAELGIAARISPAVRGEIVLLYEDDGDEALDVDVAAVTFQPTDAWFLTAGQIYLPFGLFETGMISDPLTLELGETRETAVLGGFNRDSFSGSLFLFDGEAREETAQRLDNFGIDLGYGLQGDGYGLALRLGYINDIGDSDGLIEYAGEIHQRVAGLAIDATLEAGPFRLIGEYTGAREAFETGEEPSAHNLEVGYGFSLYGREASLAIGIQGTQDAEGTGLPEKIALATLSVGLREETALGFEISSAEDYQGVRSKALLIQLATEF
jgi:hypothetical protein